MKKYKLILIACLSGVLLSLAWSDKGFSPLLLIAFIPLLWVENYIAKDSTKRFSPFAGLWYSYLPFLVWNILTTYWVWFSTPVAIVAFTANALLMAIAFQLFHYTRKRLYNGKGGYFALPVYWIGFEFFHLNCWDLSWPWLTLGNGFATMPQIVQWYQFTGVLGGSLWILLCNILIFKLIKIFFIKKEKQNKKQQIIWISIALAVIVIPSVISLVQKYTYKKPKNAIACDVVATQPNLDPYAEQYELTSLEVADRIIKLAVPLTDNNTEFILTPESAIQEHLFEEDIPYSPSLAKLDSFLHQYSKATFIVGLATRDVLPQGLETYAMREFHNVSGRYYECYNSALLLQKKRDDQILHKSKLTPGVEIMPYIKYIPFISDLAIDLGGTTGSLGIAKERIVFQSETGTKVATLICYESIYGDYVARYMRKGAELIFIITNDGWWKNTPGHRQHFQYARLRAIEFRKCVARSGNTGISGFISPTGEILQKTKYWEEDAIKQTLYRNKTVTFYAKYGDYIGRISLVCTFFLFLVTFVQKRMAKFKKKTSVKARNEK